MELSMLMILALASVFLLSCFLLLHSWASPKAMDTIPGTLGWPIVGESFSFISEFSSPLGIYNFMKTRQERYGKVFKSFVLGRFTVFMTGREASKILLTGKDGMVSLNLFYTGKQVLGPTSLLQTTGEAHKRLRHLIAEPLSLDGLKKHFQFINTLAIETLDQWAGRKVLVLEEASTFTLKVIGNMIMSLEPTGEEQEKFRANFKIISSSFASLPFKIPGTAFHRGMKARDRMYVMLDSIIQRRRNGKEYRQDFLESLIKKHSKAGGDKEDDDNKLTDNQLKDNILTLLVAGHDTTTAALTWLIKFLEENPSVLEHLREEHKEIQANGNGGTNLTWTEVSHMPYTNKVINETLRRATILPWFSRKAAQDFKIDGYQIKKGWSVNLDVVSIHHDPEVFPDPQKFNPSRFDATLRAFSFLGFGSGPRMCPGINLARLEISIFIHHLVCRYKWRPLEKDDSVQATLVRMPKNKYPILVEPLTTKEAWDKLKLEYQGSDRTKQMQVLNLKRDFESLTMQEDETITKYSDRIALIVNKIRSLGEEFPDARIVEKVLVTLPERFESKISSLEESRDLSQISLAELMNALQAQEQRRALRQENVTEGAFQMQTLQSNKDKNQFSKKKSKSREKSNKEGAQQKKYPTCSHCKKTTHLEKYCWWRPDAICGNCKQLGHVTKVCKYKNKDSYNAWLIDSGCTHHMCHNATIFKDLDKTYNSTVKVGNGGYVDVKGRGTVAVKTNSGIKLISNVLFVPDISQNLLSVVTQSVSDLWHKRFGHYNQRSLVELKKLELVEDMPNVSDEAQICIKRQLTTPYTPQQNGVSERKNRTVMEMARLPTKSLKNKTPYEAWYGVKPFVNHLKTFGSICYYHVPEPKRSKLDSRAQKGILIGYGTSTKGYRIFCLQTNKVVLSRNVKVDEMTTWDWQNKKDAQSNAGFNNHEDFQTSKSVDDFPVRGTRSLEDIYQRCSLAITELTSYFVERPKNHKVIGVKWVFKTKLNSDGSICKHKARLVVKGYAQQYGVDYQETFAPVARYDTIRLLFVLAAQNSWHIHQLDVKSAFLNGFVDEEIYVEQPDGVVAPGKEDYVYLLRKALYGLKQALRAWYETMDKHLTKLDDMLVTGNQPKLIQSFKDEMNKVFEMTDLGVMKYFLGMEVMQSCSRIFICQQKYAMDMLKKFKMQDCKPMSTPMTTNEKLSKDDGSKKINEGLYRSLIGSLLYLTLFMHSPSEKHFRQLKDSIFKICEGDLKSLGYSNDDWGGCVDDSRKTRNHSPINNRGRIHCFASVVNQALWLRKILKDLGQEQVKATNIMCDNISVVSISKNPTFHGRTKHIKIKYHFIREVQQSNEVLLVHYSFENQLADIFTKPLPTERFEALKQKIGVCHPDAKEECLVVGIPDFKP
ncbi:hypothetical protein AAG906_041222 [Vitis piasezkii]